MFILRPALPRRRAYSVIVIVIVIASLPVFSTENVDSPTDFVDSPSWTC